MRQLASALFCCFISVACAQQAATPKKLSSFEIQRAHLMLRQAHDEVVKNYYDPKFQGDDLEKMYQLYDARINNAQSVNETFQLIAGFLETLHDSHTFFLPPARQNRSTPGFAMQMVGDKCLITRVRPGTDAAAKLHVGDQVLAFNGFTMKRAASQQMEYFFQILSPAPVETLDLLSPAGEQRHEVIKATMRQGKAILDLASDNDSDYWELVRQDEQQDHLDRERLYTSGDTVVWKMPTFTVSPGVVEKVFNKIGKSKTLILDLRGNSGGYGTTLQEMLGHVFNHEVTIATLVARSKEKPMVAKSHNPVFEGNLIVLVDNRSASAAELFARVVQLEKRGKVMGDRTSGAVMEANDYAEQVGGDYAVFYAFSVTKANLLMTDGKSLENTGVVPDEVILPQPASLAAGEDVVLSQAATSAGLTLTPAAAGKLFPFEWAPL